MRLNKKTVTAGFVAAALFAGIAAWALPAFTQTFATTYKLSATSALAKAQCAVCHPSKSNTATLNPYGKDLQKAMKAKKATAVTAAVLKAVEKLDSDKDCVTNIKEIKAGTLPGDPKSHPKTK